MHNKDDPANSGIPLVGLGLFISMLAVALVIASIVHDQSGSKSPEIRAQNRPVEISVSASNDLTEK